ncbi:SLAM family member 5 isoform X2 [Platichthys flesus]|uniref:SLAM family member 5 isoform X2 n=1 Tax=Platichthys flesus TaxID=8260 RepID=UPI002DBA94E7|nr:SLAM family member 5 isoform X2 [Platichthys flesus]
MVGGRLRCLSCFFTHSELLLHLLLLGVCFHDVEASGCDRTVHKQVGDTVEFPSCSSPGSLTYAQWDFNNSLKNVMEELRFEGRVQVNPTNFSLTVKQLTFQDSGTFRFLSEVNDKQMTTVFIRLHVQEPSPPPVLSFNSTFHPSNGSCTVWLECVSTSDSNVSYSWSVRNQTLVGPRLRYTIRPQDGGTNFTCTISSSEGSTSETVTCVNSSSDSVEEKHKLLLFVGLAAGGVLIVGLVAVIVVCHCKQRPADPDSSDLTVYADITEAAEESNGPRTSMKCSVYETVGDPVNAVKPGPHTVYDKIQLGRMKAAPVSLYQDVQGIRQ